MIPVTTDQTYVHLPAYADVGSIDVGLDNGNIFSVWECSDEERAAIAQGSRVILTSPVPVVVSITVEP